MRIPLVCALVAVLAACETTDPERRTYLHSDIFEDIPAPRGATYRDADRESFSYRTQTFRAGVFVYDWTGSDTEAVRFYRETMTTPPYSWTLTDETAPGEGSTQLTFVKGDDRAIVDVDRIPRPQARDHVRIMIRVNYLR